MTQSSIDKALEKTSWGDVQLHALSWIEEGRDVVFQVRLPGTEPDRVRSLVCRWVQGLVVNLLFNERQGGHALTWDTTFTREPDGTWSVLLDFAHAGEIRLKCNEVELLGSPVAET